MNDQPTIPAKLPPKKDRRRPPVPAAKSVKNSHTSPRAIRNKMKIAEALNYRLQGYSYEQIAQQFNVSTATAFYWVDKAITEIPREVGLKVLHLELRRLDDMQAAIFAQALEGDLNAQAAVDRIMNRRAKLLGLDAPVKAALTDSSGKSMVTGIEISFVTPPKQQDGDTA